MGFLFFLFICAGLFWVFWKWLEQQSYIKRLTAKIILVYITGFVAVVMVLGLIAAIGGVFTSTNEGSLAYRQTEVAKYMEEGDYYYAEMTMRLGDDFEECFDYAWERVAMYREYNQLALFHAAGGNPDLTQEQKELFAMHAEVCAERLHRICEESTIADNEPYREFYLRRLEQMNADE